MKGLFTILVVAAMGAAAYFLVFHEDETSPPDSGARTSLDSGDNETAIEGPQKADAEATADDLVAKSVASKAKKGETQAEFEKRRRGIWENLRPLSERFVPDPDKVGPCPPVSHGARGSRVVRRYLDLRNGARTWVHEDGSITTLSFGVGTYVDKDTGSTRPNEVVTSMVREKEMPVAPDDLPLVNAPKQGGNK